MTSEQLIENLIDVTLGSGAPAHDRQAYRGVLQGLVRLARAEQCAAVEMDMHQAAHAMSDHFND